MRLPLSFYGLKPGPKNPHGTIDTFFMRTGSTTLKMRSWCAEAGLL